MSNNELQWAKKVAGILNTAAQDFEQEVSRLEYKWKVERSAQSILSLPEKYQQEEMRKLDMWFGLDVHRAMNNRFDGISLGDKRIAEERKKGWSTD